MREDMKNSIIILFILLMNINIFSEEVKYKNFEVSLLEIKKGHTSLRESMLDSTLDNRTKPILFNLGMATIYEAIKIIDPKDKRTQTFKDEHNRIMSSVKDINGYVDIYFDEIITMIDFHQNVTSDPANGTNHDRKKIGKLYWQVGKASSWEDCPIEPGYSELHGETLCVTDGIIAENYCKNLNGRLPTVKEFLEAFENDETISKDSRWPKYWTSNKKNGLHLSITTLPAKYKMKPQLQADSAASIRCVWEK